MHGSLAQIRCLDCGAQTSRSDFQSKLFDLNAEWAERLNAGVAVSAPDGDAELEAAVLEGFRVPA